MTKKTKWLFLLEHYVHDVYYGSFSYCALFACSAVFCGEINITQRMISAVKTRNNTQM